MGRALIIILVGMAVIFSVVNMRVQDHLRTKGPQIMEDQMLNTQAKKLATYALEVAIRDFHSNATSDENYVTNTSSYYYNNNTAQNILGGVGSINSVEAVKSISNADSTVWDFTANVTWYGEATQQNNYQEHSSKAQIVVYPPQANGGLNPNLKNFYDFNEGSGDEIYSLLGGDPAIAHGRFKRWVEGLNGGSALKTQYDYVQDTSGITENIGKNFSVTAWIKPSSDGLDFLADWGHIVGEADNWLLSYNHFYKFQWIIFPVAKYIRANFAVNHPSGRASVSSEIKYSLFTVLDDWYFLAASYNGEVGQISVTIKDNWGNESTTSAAAPIWTEAWGDQLGNDVFMAGRDVDWGENIFQFFYALFSKIFSSLDGTIDDVGFYDMALTQEQINQAFEAYSNQLVTHLHLDGEGDLTPQSFRIASWNE